MSGAGPELRASIYTRLLDNSRRLPGLRQTFQESSFLGTFIGDAITGTEIYSSEGPMGNLAQFPDWAI